MTDVAEAIDAEAVPVTFQPPGTATYDVKGNAVPGALPAAIPAMAAIQPAPGRLLRDLPEGVRSDVGYVGWSRTMVAEAWEILYSGQNYRVVKVWPRPQDGFTKFAMARVQG